MPHSFKFQQVDVFSSAPTQGNPLAVVSAADDLTDAQMAAFVEMADEQLKNLYEQREQLEDAIRELEELRTETENSLK